MPAPHLALTWVFALALCVLTRRIVCTAAATPEVPTHARTHATIHATLQALIHEPIHATIHPLSHPPTRSTMDQPSKRGCIRCLSTLPSAREAMAKLRQSL
jgi:hypothetical protein